MPWIMLITAIRVVAPGMIPSSVRKLRSLLDRGDPKAAPAPLPGKMPSAARHVGETGEGRMFRRWIGLSEALKWELPRDT